MRAPTVSPLFIARFSGLPATAAGELTTPDLREQLRAYLDARAEAARAGASASDALFALVGGEVDAKRRGAILRLRRDLFNCRAPRVADHELAASSMQRDIAQTVGTGIAAIEACDMARRQLIGAAAAAMPSLRRQVAEAVADGNLADGILLSSAHLYRNLGRYVKASRDAELNSRDLQLERGILRYLTRASMKATPFAAFCTVVEGRMSERPDNGPLSSARPLICVSGRRTPRRNIVRINKRIFGTLWAHLKTRPGVRSRLIVDLNPTLRVGAEQFSFVAMVNGMEVFQRAGANPALTMLVEELQRHADATCGDLARLISEDPRFEASLSEAMAYLDALLDMGLLRFRSPVRTQDPDWQQSLGAALMLVDDEQARMIAEMLASADTTITNYRTADTASRDALGEALRTKLNGTFRTLGLPELPESFLILYEDCGAPLTAELDLGPAERASFSALGDLALRLQGLASVRAEMATMRQYFDGRYGADRHQVPLLTFFEDFYREHLSEHLKKESDLRNGKTDPALKQYNLFNPLQLPSVARLTQVANTWTEVIRAAWASNPNAEEIVLDPDGCPTLADLPPLGDMTPRSLAFFCQMFRPDETADRSRLLVNNCQSFLGLGKYFSRFLFLMNEGFTSRVVEENTRLTRARIIEIGGDANFNANLHPPLLQDVIEYPTGDGDRSVAGVSCNDIVVERDPDDAIGLALRSSASKDRIYAVDLGFLNPRRRPALYRLLMSFAPGSQSALMLPKSHEVATPTEIDAPARIAYRPRIAFGPHLVLARRLWSVPSALFPKRLGGESDAELFVRVNVWRAAAGLPPRVYVRIARGKSAQRDSVIPPGGANVADPETIDDSPEDLEVGQDEITASADDDSMPGAEAHGATEPASGPGAKQKTGRVAPPRSSRDFMKPQFIDFESPLLLALFVRLPITLETFTAYIEEEYPAASTLPLIDGRPHAAEYVVQLNWGGHE